MIQSQYRVAAGFALVLAGVVVAVVGYLGVSSQTEVAFQLPYFASAGVGALMLLGFGAAVLLSSQLDRDTERMEDLEEAVRQLSAEVARMADELTPVRGRGSNGHQPAEPDVVASPGPRKTRASSRA